MKNQSANLSATTLNTIQSDVKATLNYSVAENPVIQRALRKLKESQTSDNHVSHYTKHSSHAVKFSSTW